MCISYILIKLDAKYYYNVTLYKPFYKQSHRFSGTALVLPFKLFTTIFLPQVGMKKGLFGNFLFPGLGDGNLKSETEKDFNINANIRGTK